MDRDELTGDEEVLAELGGLDAVPEDEGAVDGGAGRAGADEDDDGEAADEEVEEIEIGGDDEDGEPVDDGNGYENARKKEPLGPDSSVARFEGHTDSVYCVAVSPTAPVAVSGGGDDVAYLWSTATGARIATLAGHTDSVVAAGFSCDGKLVATGSYDATVRVWDASTGELLHTLDGPGGEVEWLGWHPRGPVVLAGSADGTVWMWDVTRRALANCMQVFAGHEEGVTAGGFDPAGKTVYTGSADGGVRAFNPKTAACMHVYRLDAPVNALAFHPSADKPLLAVGTQDGVAAVINTATSKVLVRVQHTPPEELAEKAAARAAAAAAAGEEGEEEDDDAEPATRSVESVSFCGTHPFVASGATDGSVLVYDLGSSAVRYRWAHDEAVTRVAFLPASAVLAVATADGLVAYYDARDGSVVARGTGHRGMIIDAAVAAAGAGGQPRAVVTAGDDGVCRVFAH